MEEQALRLVLGPLAYDVVAADAWAEKEIERLRGAVKAHSIPGASELLAERRCLLTRRHLRKADLVAGAVGELPADLLLLCPVRTPRRGWVLGLETQNQATWWHPAGRVCVVTVDTDCDDLRLRLPWYAMLRDALSVGGCIVHAGLAALAGKGFLFLARAGGGKTTALRALPVPWTVLSDDAALVWRRGSAWRASPLPAWSWILGAEASRSDMVPWRLAEAVRLARTVILSKADELELVNCEQHVAVKESYLAATEYPAVFGVRRQLEGQIFAFAAALSRGVPAVTLRLQEGDSYWWLLADAAM